MWVIAQENDPPWWAHLLFFLTVLAVALFARARSHDPAYFETLLKGDLAARGIGLFGIAFGISLGYLLIYSPIHDALAHRRLIMIHRGAVGFPAGIVFVGSILLLAGKHSQRFMIMRRSQGQTSLQWVVTTLGVAFCLALEFGFYRFLHAMGYSGHW